MKLTKRHIGKRVALLFDDHSLDENYKRTTPILMRVDGMITHVGRKIVRIAPWTLLNEDKETCQKNREEYTILKAVIQFVSFSKNEEWVGLD